MLEIDIFVKFELKNVLQLAILGPLESQKVPMHVNVGLLVLYPIILGKSKRLKYFLGRTLTWNTCEGQQHLIKVKFYLWIFSMHDILI